MLRNSGKDIDNVKSFAKEKNLQIIEEKPSKYYYNNGKKIDFDIVVEGDGEDSYNPEEDDEIIEEED